MPPILTCIVIVAIIAALVPAYRWATEALCRWAERDD